MNCPHQKISLGLDAAYCPDCKCEFRPWTAEYKQALERSPAAPEQNASSSNAPLKVGDRVFHVAWKVVGIIHAPISPNWEVKFSNGVFICDPEELNKLLSCPSCEQPLLNLDEGCGICGWMPQQFHQPVDKHTCRQTGKRTSILADQQQHCQHDWAVLWTTDLKLVDYCVLCHCEEPVSDRSTLEHHLSSVQVVLAEYKFALSKNPRSRKQFEGAIAEKKQQLQYLEWRIAVLGDKPEPESPSTDPEPDVLGDKPEPESPSTDPEPDVLGDKPEPESPSKTRRHKGEGSGSIHWKAITRGDKEYPQAWYHYETWEKGICSAKKTKYIPKRLVAKIQELEKEKAPVKEILKVLGGQRQ